MARYSEILFVDPSVSDLDTILGNLRSEVEAIVLEADKPAAQLIAAALEGRRRLGAVHVIAHGAPGRVSFTAGEWSAVTLDDDADDLPAIGAALGCDGEFRLWSCCTGAGAAGEAFVTDLAQRTNADVAAASVLVGAAARGGTWQLRACTATRPPLTDAALESYAGILAFEITVTGTLPNGIPTKTVTHFIIDTTRKAIVGQVVLPDAAKQITSVSLTVKVPSLSASFAIGTFDDAGNFQASTSLRVNNPATDNKRATGAVGR